MQQTKGAHFFFFSFSSTHGPWHFTLKLFFFCKIAGCPGRVYTTALLFLSRLHFTVFSRTTISAVCSHVRQTCHYLSSSGSQMKCTYIIQELDDWVWAILVIKTWIYQKSKSFYQQAWQQAFRVDNLQDTNTFLALSPTTSLLLRESGGKRRVLQTLGDRSRK